MTACSFCGAANDPASRFCIDCGKPISPAPARPAAAMAAATMAEPVGAAGATGAPGSYYAMEKKCPRCAKTVDPTLPFCGHCGARVAGAGRTNSCGECGADYVQGVDVFCARCGNRVGQRVSINMRMTPELSVSVDRTSGGPRLSLIGEAGNVTKTFTLDRGEAEIGRQDADIEFRDDHFLSPIHARLELREGILYMRDLGSRNGSWLYISEPTKLADGDQLMIGSQILRFRRLGYPGPHPPEADSTRRMGSMIPTVDVAVLQQLRADGSVRDVFHLSPGRSMSIGRETGDWIFPYDRTMSGKHAEIRSEDSEFFVRDAGSRNGVAMSVRGERALKRGDRILVGDQVLRLDQV
ncbi:MAG TPA: FHA domain-containing protein [Gemmatimonadaceae bacterium]|nr:FHA domain-containing protein [Gemmatimonadaceae bacterium]